MKNKRVLKFHCAVFLQLSVFTTLAQQKNIFPVSTPVQINGDSKFNHKTQQNSEYKTLWTSEPFDHRLFIENRGQFDKDVNTNDKVIYGAQVGKAFAFFTNQGVIYRYLDAGEPKRVENKEKEAEKEKKPTEEVKPQYVNIVWEGANLNPEIKTGDKQSYDYIYPSGPASSFHVNIYKKITFINLYPGIDVEYTFPRDKDGIKYALIVHPGADLSVVKLRYINANGLIVKDREGDVIVQTGIGEVTDHAPLSYYEDGGKVKVAYSINDNTESFEVKSSYDKSKTLIVDPWTTTLPFSGSYNDGYDVDYDYKGNIYVQGSWGPEQLTKYNSAGTKQWVYNETQFNNGSTEPGYGDFAVNRNNGECYCAEGDRETTTGANVIKINTAGTLMATFGGNVNYQEIWRIAYNSCSNLLVLAGGGTNATNQAAILDTSLTTITLKNVLGTTHAYHDMTLLALDPNGSYCYMVSSASSAYVEPAYDDRLLKLPLPALTPATFNVTSATAGSFPEDMQGLLYMTWETVPSNGFNGSACSPNYLYTYDGATVFQQNKGTGGVNRSVALAGGNQQEWAGLDVDACDNLYVGENMTVKVFNSSLTNTANIPATDTVYDLMLGANYKVLYVCGHDFVQVISTGNTSITTTQVMGQATCGSCNGTASTNLTVCGAMDTTGATYLWSNGATTHTITGLCAGTYSVTITPAGNCVTKYIDSVTVTVNSGLAITANASPAAICNGSSTTINAGGGTTYTWSPGTGLSSTTGSSVNANPGSTTTYTVTGTTGGCSGTQTVTITVTPIPTVTATATSPTVCSGSSTNINAGGATTYTWSPGTGLSSTTGATVTATPTTTTTYTVTGTTSGCTSTATVTVTVIATPTVSVSPSPSTSICPGGSVSLNATGATTYLWSPPGGLSCASCSNPSANPGSTTTYTVTGTSSGCSNTATVTVTVAPTPTITVTPPTPSVCPGGSVILTTGGGTSYTWGPSAGLSATTGSSVTSTPSGNITYTVTGTNASGCKSSDSVTVTVSPALTVSVTPTSSTLCKGDSVVLTASGAASYSWSPLGGLSCTGCSNPTANPGSTTTYTVTGTSAGCTGKDSVTITINPKPDVSLGASPTTICKGDSTLLIATGGGTYAWGPSSGLSATTGDSVFAKPAGSTTYTVAVTGTNGCTARDTITVFVNPLPVVSVSAAPSNNICSGASVNVTASGASSYTWSPSTGLNVTTGTTVSASPTVTTTYTVTGTNSSGCKDTAQITIHVTPTPTLSITPSAPGICPGDSVQLSISGATTYLWSPPGGLSCTGCSNPIANPGSTTTYTVTGTNGSCSATDSVTINVGVLKVTATAANPTICSGASTTITAGGAVTYTWSPATGLSATTGISVTATPTATTTYSLTGKSGSGCMDSATVTITVNPTPTISVSPSSSLLCKGTSVPLSASGATTYSWSPPGGLSCTSCNNPTANPGSTTIYTVTGTSSGCSSKDSVIITVDKPTVTPSASSPTICAGNSTTLSATGATTYLWSPPGGLSCTSCSNPTANPGSTTTYTVVGTDTAGCNDTNTITVTVNPKPVVNVSATDTTICSGSATTLFAGGASTYTWSPATGLSCTTCSNPGANPGATTTYTIVGANGSGCKDTVNFTLTVNPTPTISISVSGNDTICKGQSATLTASGAAASYVWSTGATTSSINVNPSSATTYTVHAFNGKCADSAVKSIYIYPPLRVAMGNDSICAGRTASIGVSASGGEPSYSFTWNNGLGSGPGPFTVNPASTTYYVCTTIDGCGDTVKDSLGVVTYASPKVAFTSTPDTIMGGQFVSFVNLSTNSAFYFWNLGDGTTSNDTSVLHQYNPAGAYIVYLVGSNARGCVDTAWDTIYVEQGITIPNVFTPNGDGQNDVFHIKAGGLQTYFIEIFNRWGEKVFESDSPNIDWTGRSMSGVEESDGVYYYIIKASGYDGKQYSYDGYLELIRGR